MADRQPTNVIEAGNIIKGLMTGETSEEVTPVETAEAEPTEQETEETEVETSSEETVNPSGNCKSKRCSLHENRRGTKRTI